MAPRPPETIDPLVETWPRAKPLFRVHRTEHPANEAYATEHPARFRPLRSADGELVPMLYCAETERGAIAESVLHDLAPNGPRVVAFETLAPVALGCLLPERDLRLAQLHSAGLDRLHVRNTTLIDTSPSRYRETVPWGQALYNLPLRLDGIVWMSRRYNIVRACVLFGETAGDVRVETADLAFERAQSFPTLAFGEGYELVVGACDDADVLITHP